MNLVPEKFVFPEIIELARAAGLGEDIEGFVNLQSEEVSNDDLEN